jgi:hypothetical protein
MIGPHGQHLQVLIDINITAYARQVRGVGRLATGLCELRWLPMKLAGLHTGEICLDILLATNNGT